MHQSTFDPCLLFYNDKKDNSFGIVGIQTDNTLLFVDWPDLTVGPRTGQTGLICKQSSLKFQDRNELQSQNPLGPDCTTVRS
jgi:hypothetical protein